MAIDLGKASFPLLAVSGGPDSIALLLLMFAQRPGSFAVATFDHGLRAEAAAEAAFVASVCAERDIAHVTLRPTRRLDAPPAPDSDEARSWHNLQSGPPIVGGELRSIVIPKRESLQARARTARYDALARHAHAAGHDAIVTAHHRDDQAETFLMRASRGSGVDGLAGIRGKMSWNGVAVLRPLLDIERSALGWIVRDSGIEPVQDPSNADPAYDRTRFRTLLAENDDLKVDGLLRSAAALAEASEALDWMVARLATERIDQRDDRVTLDVRDLPRELQRRLLTAGFRRLGKRIPRGSALDGAMRALDEGGKSSLGDLLVEAEARGIWALYPAPPRRSH